MWRYDFHLFYMGAKAILAGASPYQQWDFNGPYPLALFFIPFALLPEPLAYLIYLVINLGLFWKVIGLRRGIWSILSFPVAFCLFVGQVDLMLALLSVIGAPWTLGLLIIKPQVGFILFPWFIGRLKIKDYPKIVLVAGALIGLSFLLNPHWIQEWLAGSPGLELYATHASNIYWLIPDEWKVIGSIVGALLAFPIALFFKERRLSWSFMTLFGPLTNIYTPSVLAEWIGPIEFALSWLAILIVGGRIHAGAPELFVAISIISRSVVERKRPV